MTIITMNTVTQIRIFTSSSREKLQSTVNEALTKVPDRCNISSVDVKVLGDQYACVIVYDQPKETKSEHYCTTCGIEGEALYSLDGKLFCKKCYKDRMNYNIAMGNIKAGKIQQ